MKEKGYNEAGPKELWIDLRKASPYPFRSLGLSYLFGRLFLHALLSKETYSPTVLTITFGKALIMEYN
jgi:hypothetical protein